MARAQYGAIITDLKGSLGGTTFQGGNTGKVVKNKGYRRGSNTQTRTYALTQLQAVTRAWRSLTSEDRNDWNTRTNDWPFTDKFGNTYYGSGYQFYCAYNMNMLTLGQTVDATPNAIQSAANIGDVYIDSLEPEAFVLAWDNAVGTNAKVVVYASPQYSAGRNENNPRLTLITTGSGVSMTDIDVTAQYESYYGELKVGAKVIVKVLVRDIRWPIDTQTQTISGIVTAP